jgi:mono/diheme cytochrome c family protein/cytochrome bd-type quinol oxidase subunit 1
MNYPFWDTGLGYGWLMATIAVLHVFVSHFAIGGGLYLVLTERAARRAGDVFRLEFLRGLSKFFVLTTVVFGALTGVGIWFIIGLLNPTATEALIHNFVWGWAIEWTFFVVEITAAILYFYGWDRVSPKNHMILGWIYFVFAWLSLFIINGIITFMLTPGTWLTTGNFWNGFFNPTAIPSLVFRTGICVMLAGIYALLVASRSKPDQNKAKLVRYNTAWGLVGLAIMIPSFFWYWKAIPAPIITAAETFMRIPMQSIHSAYWLAGLIVVCLILFGLLLPRKFDLMLGVIMMVLALGWIGEFEWFRESLRKPYVVTGYIYGNAVEVSQLSRLQSDGYLPHMAYRTGNDGADLFRHACRSCHTLDGARALKPAFDGTDAVFISSIVKAAGTLRGNMPPFVGTPEEADKLADYLYGHMDHKSIAQIYNLQGAELGRKVYDIRCGKCHVMGGYKDKTASLAGQTNEDYNTMLDNAADLGDGMPPFTGDSTERLALIEYFKTLKTGGNNATAGL